MGPPDAPTVPAGAGVGTTIGVMVAFEFMKTDNVIVACNDFHAVELLVEVAPGIDADLIGAAGRMLIVFRTVDRFNASSALVNSSSW